MSKLEDLTAALGVRGVDLTFAGGSITVPLELIYANMAAVRSALRKAGFFLRHDDGNPGSIIYSGALKVRILEQLDYPAAPSAGSRAVEDDSPDKVDSPEVDPPESPVL